MKTYNSNEIHRNIKKFRILAISFALFIALLSSVMIIRTTSSLDNTSATKINLAGHQRELAQRIVTDALKIDIAIRVGEWDSLKPVLAELQSSTSDLENTHAQLASGWSSFNLDGNDATERKDAFDDVELPLRQLVSSSDELQALTISMIRRAPYIDQQTFDRVNAAKDEIEQAHALFFPRMNQILDEYERAYKRTIASSIGRAKFGMAILIGVLVAILLFVIEPTFLIIRRQVAQLTKAINQAQRADAVRWRLLTNIGHEFRTPMTAIMGFADLLNTSELSESERSRLTQSIYSSSAELTALIENMLDMSAIEAGQLRIAKKPCELTNILSDLYRGATAKALTKDLQINLTIDPSCPQRITTDPKRLEQILTKITENAIKFTPSGTIDISAQMNEINQTPVLEIIIADTGVGIDQEFLKTIFDPFRQGQDTLTRQFGGAGLGLAVSRDLARALGGDVAVESTLNEGSVFRVTIDPGELAAASPSIADSREEQRSDEAPGVLNDCRVLVVDDAKDNRILLKHILSTTGAQIEFACDGQQALNAVLEADKAHTPFDLVLMDMQMPVMDGYFASVKIREAGIETPIMAVTAHALEGDRQHCLDSGCSEYLTKPIDKGLLLETCIRLINEQRATAAPVRQAA